MRRAAQSMHCSFRFRSVYAILLACFFHSIAEGAVVVCDENNVLGSQDACTNLHRENYKNCVSGFAECGDCLSGFSEVASVCVDLSTCQASQTQSKVVLLLDSSGSLRQAGFSEEKNLAKELVNVFPVNELAVISFGTDIMRYPKSGGFVDKAEALKMIPDISYHGGLQSTSTGKALKEAVKMLENERESFNMVIVMTDGRATDGPCAAGTCDANTDKCTAGDRECTMVNAAPKLRALADRNQTVTVVSVGFGAVDENELKFIASSDENVLMAQAQDAASGLANLKKLLNQLIAKVCGNLPHDCVVGHTPWSACDAPCGPQTRKRKWLILHEERNGGRPCPSKKAMFKTFTEPCPEKPCSTATAKPTPATSTANTATTVKPASTDKSTTKKESNANTAAKTGTGEGTTKKESNANTAAKTGTGTDTVITTNSGSVANEVDGGNVQRAMWTLAIMCYVATLFV